MHLTLEPDPLRARCNAPVELCDLVSRMLHKRQAARPTAVEVRQIARAIARDLSQAYEEFVLSGIEIDQPRGNRLPASDETPVADPNLLEYGVTEMLPVVRKPRWTPEFGRVPSMVAEQSRQVTIAPRAPRDQVAGEIVLTNKPR